MEVEIRKSNKALTFITVIIWVVFLVPVGAVIGFILPLIIFRDAQAGLGSIFVGAPGGVLLGMSAGIMIGIYRSEKIRRETKKEEAKEIKRIVVTKDSKIIENLDGTYSIGDRTFAQKKDAQAYIDYVTS